LKKKREKKLFGVDLFLFLYGEKKEKKEEKNRYNTYFRYFFR